MPIIFISFLEVPPAFSGMPFNVGTEHCSVPTNTGEEKFCHLAFL